MSNESAGIGDPYWYEWSVGLLYVLEMLDPSSGIAGVTIQAAEVPACWSSVNATSLS
jgi:hypothetical protein